MREISHAAGRHGPASAGPAWDARYVDASRAEVCALVGDDVGVRTESGWRTTIDVYAAAWLLDQAVAPGAVLSDSR